MKRSRKGNKRRMLGILCSLSLILSVLPVTSLRAMEAGGQEILSEDKAGEETGQPEGLGQTEKPEGETADGIGSEGENPDGGTDDPSHGKHPEEAAQGKKPGADTQMPGQGENQEKNLDNPGQIEVDEDGGAESTGKQKIQPEPEVGAETEVELEKGTEAGDAREDILELSEGVEDTDTDVAGGFSYTDAEGNEFAYVLDENGNAMVTGITVSGGTLAIPELIDGAPVTSVSGDSECVVSNPETAVPSLYVNSDSVGAKAFAGLSIGTLTIGEKVSLFSESPESTNASHCWNQFAGTVVGTLHIDAPNLCMEHTTAKELSQGLKPPFEGAEIGKLEIGESVETIPEYFLYKATMEMEELTVNAAAVGAYAFAGGGISIGALTIGSNVSAFKEDYYSSPNAHYWNQFAGTAIGSLHFYPTKLSIEHTEGKGLSDTIYPPFEGANVGALEIGADVEEIPEYFLYKATMETEELTVNAATVGAYAFAGGGISIGALTIGSGVSAFKEDYYSSPNFHYWNQFAGATVGSLHFYPANLIIEHTAERGLSDAISPPFEGAKVGMLEIGPDVGAIPEYLLYKANMEMEELTVNAAVVGAYAFAGGGITIGTLTIGGNVSVFKEDYYSSPSSHYWNQFAGAAISSLRFYPANLTIEHTAEKGLADTIYPPFEGAKVGTLEIDADVEAIPEYFLYKAAMEMEELTVNAAMVGAYAFAGGNIVFGTLTIGNGVLELKEDYYSSPNVHHWEQFAGVSIRTLRLCAAELATGHTAAKGLSNSAYGPFYGASVGILEIGQDVGAIPEYFLHRASLSMGEFEINVPEIGAYAFAGGSISFDVLTLGRDFKVFKECYYSSPNNHQWNQFMGSRIGRLSYAAKEAETVNDAASYNTFNLNIYGPFRDAEIGVLEIKEGVKCIPDYFLHNAKADLDYLCLDVPVIGAMAFMGAGMGIGRLVVGENVSHFASAKFNTTSSLYWNQFNGATLGTVDYHAKSAVLDNLKGGFSYYYSPFYKVKIASLNFGDGVESIPDFCFHETVLEQDELAIHAGTIGGSAFYSPNISIGTLTVGKGILKFSSTKSRNSYYYRQFGKTRIGKLIYEAEDVETGMSCSAGPFEGAQIGEAAFNGEVAVIPNFLLYNAKITFEDFVVSVPAVGCYSFSGGDISFGSLTVGENVSRFMTDSGGYSNAFYNCSIGKLRYNAVEARLGDSSSGEYGPFYGADAPDIAIGESVRYLDVKMFRENSFTDCDVYPVEASEEFLSQQPMESCLPSTVNLSIHHNSGFAAFFTSKAESTEWMCEDFYEISYGKKTYDEELGEYRIEVIRYCPVCGYTEGSIEDLDESYDVRFSVPVEVPLAYSQDNKSYQGSGTVYAYGRLGNAYDGVRLSVDSCSETFGMAEIKGNKINISPFLSVGFESGEEAAFTPSQVAENQDNILNGDMDLLHMDNLKVSIMGSAFLASGAGEYSIPIPLRIEVY